MANSDLQGKYFDIPKDIKKHLNKIFNAYKGVKNVEGYQRLEELVDKDTISYEQLKLMKNFFDSHNGGKKETKYLLNGGSLMKKWVQGVLDNARQKSKGTDDSLEAIGIDREKDKLPSVRIDSEEHDSDTNKILRQEGIYNMRLLEDLITIFDKNKKLCQDQHSQ